VLLKSISASSAGFSNINSSWAEIACNCINETAGSTSKVIMDVERCTIDSEMLRLECVGAGDASWTIAGKGTRVWVRFGTGTKQLLNISATTKSF
jgi:hypothetical protein